MVIPHNDHNKGSYDHEVLKYTQKFWYPQLQGILLLVNSYVRLHHNTLLMV